MNGPRHRNYARFLHLSAVALSPPWSFSCTYFASTPAWTVNNGTVGWEEGEGRGGGSANARSVWAWPCTPRTDGWFVRAVRAVVMTALSETNAPPDVNTHKWWMLVRVLYIATAGKQRLLLSLRDPLEKLAWFLFSSPWNTFFAKNIFTIALQSWSISKLSPSWTALWANYRLLSKLRMSTLFRISRVVFDKISNDEL